MTATLATSTLLYVGPRLMLVNATPAQAAALRERLDFAYTAREMVRGTMQSIVRTYPVVQDAPDGVLTIPVGCLATVRALVPYATIRDLSVSPAPATPFHLVMHGDDRDGQREALEGYWRANGAGGRGGCIIAPCGAGKSRMGMKLISVLGVRTLVIVHTRELLEQWRDALQRAFPAVEVTVIAAGKVQIGDITVALVQTLRLHVRDVAREFGLVIHDEVHHVCAETFAEVMGGLYARVKIGLTASEKRPDGLSPLVEALCGPIVARISQDAMTADGVVLAPTVRVVRTGWTWDGDAVGDYTRMLSAMVEDAARNELLVNLASLCANDGRHVLALSARTEHLRHLCRWMNEERPGIAQIITGKEKAADRRAAMQAMKAGEVPVTFATTAIAKEGLDAPIMDTLLWCSPVKNPVTVQQSVGRAQRALDGKPAPLVIDLRDDRCERRSDLDDACSSERVLFYQYKARERVYSDLRAGWE